MFRGERWTAIGAPIELYKKIEPLGEYRKMSEFEPPDPEPAGDSEIRGSLFIFYAALFEGSLAGLAVLLGWFGLAPPEQPLGRIAWREQLFPALVWGSLGTLPPLTLLWWIEHYSIWPFRDLKEVSAKHIRPLFAGTALHELLLVALLAGLGEELLFRWSLQGGLAAVLGDSLLANLAALLVASLLFGMAHFLNLAYFTVTFVMGIYFGCLMWWSGSWLAPALAHGLYDLIALIYLTRFWQDGNPSQRGATS